MRWFHIDPDAISGDTGLLAGEEAYHIATVLRLTPGEPVTLFDGSGQLYEAQLLHVDRHQVRARLLDCHPPPAPSPCPLTLAQGILKGKKMDLIVQKATELGVHELVPVISRYSQAMPRTKSADRWHRIMLAACKQCHRATFMHIRSPIDIRQLYLGNWQHTLIPWELEKKRYFNEISIKKTGPILLVIGPEGGLHQEEITHCRNQGALTLTLGRRILRAETAALAAMTLLQSACENLYRPL